MSMLSGGQQPVGGGLAGPPAPTTGLLGAGGNFGAAGVLPSFLQGFTQGYSGVGLPFGGQGLPLGLGSALGGLAGSGGGGGRVGDILSLLSGVGGAPRSATRVLPYQPPAPMPEGGGQGLSALTSLLGLFL